MVKVFYANRAFMISPARQEIVMIKELLLTVIVEDNLVVCGYLKKAVTTPP